MSERLIWRDGEFIAWDEATVHVLSQSLQRGSLAFDYVSVRETTRGVAVFRLRDHVERLLTTCRIVGLPLAWAADDLIEACAEAVRRNQGATSIKISALIPSVEVELVPQDPRVAVFIAAYDSAADIIAKNPGELRRRQTLSLKVERDKSGRREDVIPPHAKVAASYTAPMTAKWKARREGYDDVILLDEHGHVAEAPTMNLFVVDDGGELLTPEGDRVLLGITRSSVMGIAGAEGLTCRETPLTEAALKSAQEVFLTGTSVGVWPVVRIDNEPIGDGTPGATTQRLAGRYRAIVSGEDPAFDHWLHFV